MLCTSTKSNHTLNITLHHHIIYKGEPIYLGSEQATSTARLFCGDHGWANITKSTANFYHLVKGGRLSLSGRLAERQRDGGLKDGVLVPDQANDPFHMDPNGSESSSSGCSCCLPSVKLHFSCAQNRPTVSLTLKPLSARMTSPGDSFSR